MNIKGEVALSGLLHIIGSGTLTFYESCSTTDSIGIGGSSLSDRMTLEDSELALISASSSATIIFQSTQGAIDINAVTQATDMQRTNNAAVQITADAQKTISFVSGASSFAKLTVSSSGGIDLQQDLSTTSGNMALTFTNADLDITANADLTSAGTLTVTGFAVDVAGTTTWDSIDTITINPTVTMASGADFVAKSKNSITVAKNITSVNTVEIFPNYDCGDTSGTITVATDAIVSAGTMNIKGEVSLSGLLHIVGSGTLTFYESCSTTDSIGIGGSSLSDRMTLEDSELALISASSSATIIFQSTQGAIDINAVTGYRYAAYE
jgi:hypothetical protein